MTYEEIKGSQITLRILNEFAMYKLNTENYTENQKLRRNIP